MLQSSVAGSCVVGGGFTSRGLGGTTTKPVPSKPVSIVGLSKTTSGGYSGSNTYQTLHSQYGSDGYYSSATTTASYGHGLYGSYQSGPPAASKQALSYTQPVGRGSYAVAGDDSSYSTYSGASGYDSGYQTPAGRTDTSAAGTYGAYDESDYYMETEENQSYAGYGSSGTYGTVGSSQESYDYSSSYDSGYNSGYGSVSSVAWGHGTSSTTTMGYGTDLRSMTAASYTTTASNMRAGGSFGRPVSYTSTASTLSMRASSSATRTATLSTDQYYTTAAKPDPFASYEGGDDQSYYYSETDAGYGGYGESASEYQDYNSSNQDTGGEWGYPADQTMEGDQSYAASTGYYESASQRDFWSATPTGLGRGTGQPPYTSTQKPLIGGPTGPCSTSNFHVPYGTLSTAASTGFQASLGGRQTAAGGTSFQSSLFSTSSASQSATTFSTAATGYSSAGGSFGRPVWGDGGGQKSASVGPVASQRTPRVDGFTSFVSGTVSSSGATKPTGTTWFSEPRSDSEKRPSRWSDGKAGTSDTQQDTRRHSAGNAEYGRSSSVQQSSDSSTPRVFDYGHRDCDEQHAARSSDRSYYLANVNTDKPATASKRRSSPSPDYRRPSASVSSDWQTSSWKDDGRESSRSLAAGRSRDDHRSSLDTHRSSADSYDHRKSMSYSEKSSSSGPARHGTSFGQGSFTQGRPSQDRWYTTEPSTSSRSSSVGQRTGEPARTVARTVPGLMDSMMYSTSSAKTTPVCIVYTILASCFSKFILL